MIASFLLKRNLFGFFFRPRFDFVFARFLFDGEKVNERGEGAASERTDDENPDLFDRLEFAGEHGNDGRTDGTGRVDRGAGEADAEEVDEDQAAADDDTGDLAVVIFVGDAEDGEHEDEGEDDFDDEANKEATDIAVSLEKVTADGVRANGGEVFGEEADDEGADEGADDLADDVAEEFLDGDLLGDEHREGDGRVDVAARDAADRVDHRDDDKAEGKGGGDEVDAGPHGDAAAEDDEDEGTDAFSDILFEVIHEMSSFRHTL